MSGCRIGRVRMKNGGADIRVLSRPDRPAIADNMIDNAAEISRMARDDAPLFAYVIVGFFADGTTSSACRYEADPAPVPRVMLPAAVSEIVRRDLITAPEAADEFDRRFERI